MQEEHPKAPSKLRKPIRKDIPLVEPISNDPMKRNTRKKAIRFTRDENILKYKI